VSASSIHLALVFLALAGPFAWLIRNPGWRSTPHDARITKWIMFAVALWIIGIYALVSLSSNICLIEVDPMRRGNRYDFVNCTPQLLSGGFADLFLFAWFWGPPAVLAFFSARYLIRLVRGRIRNRKES